MKIEYTPERGRGFVRPGETGKPQNWGFSGIKKAAPKWSRLSEQITRCAVCVCDLKHKHGDDSRYQAGGQCDQPGGRFLFAFITLGCLSRTSSSANLVGAGSVFGGICLARAFSCWREMILCKSNLRCSAKISSADRCFLLIVLTCKAMRRSTSRHGADSDYSDSLAFRRCSYFNLRPQASKTHAEKLALGLVNFSCSTLASIPSISSCGNRIFFFADLLFVLPLDIDAPHLNGLYGRTQYSKKNEMLSIDMCAHMILICAHSLSFVTQIKQRPAVLATHAGRLTNNVNEEPLWLP